MRLGLRPTVFEPNSDEWSKVRKLYGCAEKIWERHRQRYEVNPDFIDRLTESGMPFVGKDEKGERMQILELPGIFIVYYFLAVPHEVMPIGHPFFVGLQAHPEFCTRPLNPSPPFLGFVAAASGPKVLEDQLEIQLQLFQPPHPVHAMVSEAELRNTEPTPPGKEAAMSPEQ